MKNIESKNFKTNLNLFLYFYSIITILCYNLFFWEQILLASNFTIAINIFLIILFAFIAFLSLVCVRYTTKAILITITTINSFCIYFINNYHIAIDQDMIINALKTDISEFSELFNWKIVLFVILFGILPSLAIAKIEIVYRKFWNEVKIRIISCSILALIAIIVSASQYKKLSISMRENKSNFGYLVPRNYLNSILKIYKSTIKENKEVTSIGDDLVIKNNKPRLVVLVVGETARRKNFSLYGYSRQTNPLLQKRELLIINNATSCGTSTQISVPCMLSHLSRNEYINKKENYQFLPKILEKNGIKVLYKDNNFGGCYKTCEGVETIATQQESDKKLCNDNGCYDGLLLKNLQQYIKKNQSDNIFIVLHQNGSHGPRYNKRYPNEFEKFKPICQNSDISSCAESELINAYDNTILYTDYFLDKLIDLVEKSGMISTVIYASDHGESLGENGVFLHGFPYNFAPNVQKEIPFIIWTSKEFDEVKNIDRKRISERKESSHDNIFHTVLGAFSAETELYDEELDVFANDGNKK